MDKTAKPQNHREAAEGPRDDAATIEALSRGAAQIQRGEGIDLDTAERQLRLKHSFHQ